MVKIYIAIPAFRYIEPDTRASIERAISIRKNWELGAFKELLHQSMICRARNIFAKLFLETNCTHLLFIDADMVLLTPNAIDMLVAANKEIIAGVYAFKDYPHKPAIRFLNKKDKLEFDKEPRSGIFEVKYASTGFMLIRREVFLTLNYLFPFRPYAVNGEYLSEDWAFCDRAAHSGFSIYVMGDKDLELGHLGLYPYTIRDYRRLKERGRNDRLLSELRQ